MPRHSDPIRRQIRASQQINATVFRVNNSRAGELHLLPRHPARDQPQDSSLTHTPSAPVSTLGRPAAEVPPVFRALRKPTIPVHGVLTKALKMCLPWSATIFLSYRKPAVMDVNHHLLTLKLFLTQGSGHDGSEDDGLNFSFPEMLSEDRCSFSQEEGRRQWCQPLSPLSHNCFNDTLLFARGWHTSVINFSSAARIMWVWCTQQQRQWTLGKLRLTELGFKCSRPAMLLPQYFLSRVREVKLLAES